MIKNKKKICLYLFFLAFIFCTANILLNKIYRSKIFFYGYEHKIWAHRVNSIEKLKESILSFQGVEVDVVYMEDNNFFDVNHPPAKSIGLSLDKYFSSIISPNKKKYWIDFKNLKDKNQDLSLKRLEYLIKKHHLNKENLIIESKSYSNLDVFDTNGYIVSYYLPQYLHKLETNELLKKIKLIKKNLKNRPNMAISSSFKNYYIMEKYFSSRKKFLWFIVRYRNYKHLQTIKLLRDILNDNNVKVILITFKSRQGNR